MWNINKNLFQHKILRFWTCSYCKYVVAGNCHVLFELIQQLSLEEMLPLPSTHVSKPNMFMSSVLLGSWSRISCPPPPNSDRKCKTVQEYKHCVPENS